MTGQASLPISKMGPSRWRLAILGILLAAMAAAYYFENNARRQSEAFLEAFPQELLQEYPHAGPRSIAAASTIGLMGVSQQQGPFPSMVALRNGDSFRDPPLGAPSAKIRRVLSDRFALEPETSEECDRIVWHGILNNYEVSFSYETRDQVHGCRRMSLTPIARITFLPSAGVLTGVLRLAVIIACACFVALRPKSLSETGPGNASPLQKKWEFAGSSPGTFAFLATAAICLLGWQVWQLLLQPFPAQRLQFDNHELFVGPYQINSLFVQIVPIVDTRAQRFAYLGMVGAIGFLVLLRRFWLPLASSFLNAASLSLSYGILAIAAIWIIPLEPIWLSLVHVAATVLLLFLSHRVPLSIYVRWLSATICLVMCCAAVFPVFSTYPSISHRSWDDIICIQGHFYAILGQGDQLAAGHILFAEVKPNYGLLLPSLAAAYQIHWAPLNWGDYLRIIQALQIICLLLFLSLYYWYSRKNWLYCAAALTLIVPWYVCDQPAIFSPSHTGWRMIGIPIALTAMFATRHAGPKRSALASGVVSALCILTNFETGFAVSVGLVSYLAFRQRILERWDFRLWATLAANFAVGWIVFFVLFLFFFRTFLGYWPSLARFLEMAAVSRNFVGSGIGSMPIALEPWPMLIFAHACFVIVQTCARPGLWRCRPAYRASVALMICIWFSYYVNRPHPENVLTYHSFYGFLLIDLLRNLNLQIAVRRKVEVLTLAGCVVWVAIILPVMESKLSEAFFQPRPQPQRALVCGIYFPKDGIGQIISKAEFIKEKARQNPKIVYLTPHSFLMPSISGVYPASGIGDLGWESSSYAGYMECLRRLTTTSDVIYIDAEAPTLSSWAFGGIYRRLRDDLHAQFTCSGIEGGWEVWRRNTP
jgi:hypothetical protein